MSEFTSPVTMPALDAVDPGVYRQYYGIPMFTTIPTGDLKASKDFWIHGLGFIDLFSIPGRLCHLRRWAFQDILLVTGEPSAEPPSPPCRASASRRSSGSWTSSSSAARSSRPGARRDPMRCHGTPWT